MGCARRPERSHGRAAACHDADARHKGSAPVARIGYDFPRGRSSGLSVRVGQGEETGAVVQRRGRRSINAGRRRRRRAHLLPLAALAVIAFAGGVVVGRGQGANERAIASEYVRDWARSDFGAMYGLLDAASRQAMGEAAFTRAYRRVADTATMIAVSPGRVGRPRGHRVRVAMRMRTRLFGILSAALEVPISTSSGGTYVHFAPTLLFPGLRAGEHLTRDAVMPARADLLASDGTPLARGPHLDSPIPDVAAAIAGVLGPIPARQARRYSALGYPPSTKVGLDGLQRIFQTRLAGTPGGTLLAGRRILAQRPAQAAGALRTTIDPAIERAVIAAIAGRYAGLVAMDPRTGAVLAAAGVAFSALQPPGSTMKIVTASGLLGAGLVSLTDTFAIATEATIDGFALQNANGEACGGTLLNSFAVSCNSVFAPLGVRLGASRFLSIAQRFGFNTPSPIPGEPASTIPPASVRGSNLELGASAIGQGKVQATALQMADVAATIAMGGRRPIPTLLAGAPPRFVTVIARRVAHAVQEMMVAVVNSANGTGTLAQLPGVEVAGKTGTAELRNTTDTQDPNANSPANTDAWFVGYAPVGHPRIVVGALFPGQGAGGATAAPATRAVLQAALQRQ
jgi:penicillin-binding protein A